MEDVPHVNREVTINLAIVLLMLVPSQNGQGKVDHQRFIALNRQWQAIHDSASREQTPTNAILVIDPNERAIWIERAGQKNPQEIEALPAGFEWSAYHVTQRGVREIAFPIRLTRPRLEGEVKNDGETFLIFGQGTDCGWQFSITPKSNGHVFHVGSGSAVSSMTVPLSALQGDTGDDSPADSILESERSPNRRWIETIRSKQILINVQRIRESP